MNKKDLGKALIPTLLATVYTIPALAGPDDQAKKVLQPGQEGTKPAIKSEAVKQEVIQVLCKEDSDFVTLNIAGQPGTHFRVQYSAIDKEESYVLVPKGEGVIGDNGMSSVGFELSMLGRGDVYLKVKTSDKADFSQTRVTPKPFVLGLERVQDEEGMVTKGVVEKVKAKVKEQADKINPKTPSAVAGVRG
jgi:hypothetical protein